MSISPDRYVNGAKGKKTSVIPSVQRYARLLEALHDLSMVAERRTGKAIPLEAMKRGLRKHGLV